MDSSPCHRRATRHDRSQKGTGMTLPGADKVDSIVCLLLGEIGDALVCTPTLRALRRRYPQARIEVIMRPAVMPLFAASSLIDHIIPFDSASLWRKIRFMFRLRRLKCDLWVDLQAPTF